MQKRELFITIAVILIISMVGLAVTCLAPGEAPTLSLEVSEGPQYSQSENMCYYQVEAMVTGMPEPEIVFADDDNINQIESNRVEVGVEIGNSYTLTVIATNAEGIATASIILGGDCSSEMAQESGPDSPEFEDIDGDIETDTGDENAGNEEENENPDEDGEKQAPTITLEIYEGPFPIESLCVYRVQANVTGNPTPTVTFSKDDSGGSWGTRKAQVNLSDPSDTYTLTATATNSEGSATDSIELSWGCEVPEPEPEPEPEVHEISIAADPDISGLLWDDGAVSPGNYAVMGDSVSGNYSKGYFSFDISGLHGKTVQDADINFTAILTENHPESFASEIVVKVFNYVRLDASDFAVGGVQLPSIPISDASYTIGGNTLKNELQAVLDNEVRDYFQLKLGLNGITNGDGFTDFIEIYCSDVVLNISYTD